MQVKSYLKSRYYVSGIDERNYSKEVFERKEKLDLTDKLFLEVNERELVFEAMRISRSTYYRWKKRYKEMGLSGLEPQSRRPEQLRFPEWDDSLVTKVLKIRTLFPLFGKDKITVLLKREYDTVASQSTVGRIIAKLVEQNKVQPVGFYTGKYNPKSRSFNGHAQRIPRGWKARKPGELVQVDHMSVGIDNSGKWVKHFEAVCPTTRYSVGKAYRKASSNNAAGFLDYVQKELPFPLFSIQVDGGSEFMGEFEAACKARKIPLYALPPRSPEMNGKVERINSTVKSEFYKLYVHKNSLEAINAHLYDYKAFYNTFRPHSGLQGLTPMEYWEKL
jgi:transposase